MRRHQRRKSQIDRSELLVDLDRISVRKPPPAGRGIVAHLKAEETRLGEVEDHMGRYRPPLVDQAGVHTLARIRPQPRV